MEPLQILMKQNVEFSTRIPALFKATRKYYGLTQAEIANKLQIEQGTLSKIEAGRLTPTIDLWYFFCKLTNIPFESASYGFVDGGHKIKLEKNYVETGFKLPKRFSEFRADSVRNLLTLIRFFAENRGLQRVGDFLESQKVDSLFFLVYDNLLNINFRIELIQTLIKDGLFSRKSTAEIFKGMHRVQSPRASYPPIHGLDGLVGTQSREMAVKNLIEMQGYYQLDFLYELEHAGSQLVEFSIKPAEHLKNFNYRSDDSLGKFQCLYQKAHLKSYIESSVQSNVSIKEVACHYGRKKHLGCTYQLGGN